MTGGILGRRRLFCPPCVALVLGILMVVGGISAALAADSSGVSSDADVQYRLDSGDKVRVTVFGHEDLSGEFEIDGEGGLSLPLIQRVAAKGLTIPELEQAITGKLKPDYLKDPRVSIEVLNYRPFYILGEVQMPGSYPYVNGMTVIKAAAIAGGFTLRAKKDNFLITRARDSDRKKREATGTTPVLPGDVIEVQQRLF